MKEFSIKNAILQIEAMHQDVLMVVAPNYEERSNAWLSYLGELNNAITQHNKFFVGTITLQAQTHQNVFLDGLKRHNTEKASDHLESFSNHRLVRSNAVITYPQGFSLNELKAEIENWIAELKGPLVVVIDISALPRNIILSLLNIFRSICFDGTISKLYFLYTWAEKYPRSGRLASIGSLGMAQDGRKFSQFLNGIQDVRALLVASREGYSGRLFLDSLSPLSQIDTYIYMEKNDPLASHQIIYANFSLLSALEGRSNADLHYYMSIPRGHRLLIDAASQIAVEWDRNKVRNKSRAFVVAPFGPKPIIISSYIACNKINPTLGLAGIVLHSGLQYSDTYSVGIRNSSCFEVSISEFIGEK